MKINTAVANLEVLAREQKQLMKYKFLFTFLFTFEADKAIDVSQYHNNMLRVPSLTSYTYL